MPKRGEDSYPDEGTAKAKFAQIMALASVSKYPWHGIGTTVTVCCPAHPDRTPSCSVSAGRTRILLNCKSEQRCSQDQLLDAIRRDWGLTPLDLFYPMKQARKADCVPANIVARYPYTDQHGTEQYRKLRYEQPGCHKDFRVADLNDIPRSGTVRQELPYNLPAVIAAVAAGQRIYLPEGEKDVATLARYALVGTTHHGGGSAKPGPDWFRWLRGARVTVIADQDETGQRFARTVVAGLGAVGADVVVSQSATTGKGHDITDHFEAGYTVDQLVPATFDLDRDPEFEQDVDRGLYAEQVRDEVRRRRNAAGRPSYPQIVSLTELLAQPDDPCQYRVDQVWPYQGHVLLAAYNKGGKTTLRNNLVRSLADGEKFLDTFAVTAPSGGVAIFDLEMGKSLTRQWMRKIDILNSDRVFPIELVGRGAALDLLDPAVRTHWAKALRSRQVSVAVLDPIGPLMAALGLDENANTDVNRVLTAWKSLLAEAGIQESVVIHHTGHQADRARGATAFGGWADANWLLTRGRMGGKTDEIDPDSPRYFSVPSGRDVHCEESELSFDEATRRLSIGVLGQGRKQARRAEVQHAREDRLNGLVAQLVLAVEAHPGVSKKACRGILKGTNAEKDEAVQRAEAEGKVIVRLRGQSHTLWPAAELVTDE